MSIETEPASEPKSPDPIETLRALSWCLRALACGYGLLPAERAACLAILTTSIPGAEAADLAAAVKLLQAPRRLSGRHREKAGELSVRLAEQAAASVR
jgi:hypothetical protein